MLPPATNDKYDKNHYRTTHSLCQFIDDCQHKLSNDKLVYPIFDNKGYVKIVLWKSLDGSYKFNNTTKTNHKDNLFLEIIAYIDDAFCVKKHMTIDNLYLLESRYLPNCIKIFIEYTETQIRKTYIIGQLGYEPFKKTNITKTNKASEVIDDTKLNNSEEQEQETKRKRKTKN